MFTEHIHRDVYPAIVRLASYLPVSLPYNLFPITQDPSKPSLALPGKTVLVTGGGRGIGVSIVEAFAKAQAKTIILTGRDEPSLTAAKDKFSSVYPDIEFLALKADIGVPESVEVLFQSLNGKVKQIGRCCFSISGT